MSTSTASSRRAAAPRLRFRTDVTNVAFVTGLLCVIAILPVFAVKVAPLSDYVNHLARMQVIAVGARDEFLSSFYQVDWHLIPNLAMDILVPPLARLTNVYFAGQVFMAVTVLVLGTGPLAVNYAIYRKLNYWPLIGFVFLYNQVFLVGLANYLIGVGLAMWGLAAWIMIRDRALALRLVVSLGFVIVLYVCHLYAVGFYGMAIGAYEVWAWRKRGMGVDRRLATDLAALVVPALPIVPLLLMSATWGLAQEYEWTTQSKIDGLTMVVRAYADVLDIGLVVMLGLAFVWAVKQRLVRFHGAAVVLLLVGAAVFLAMPMVLFGSYMADQRLPIALFLTLLAFGRLDSRERVIRVGFVALVVGFAAIRVGDVAVHWRDLAESTRDIKKAMSEVERGSKILVAYSDDPQASEQVQSALAHAACVAMIERSALVSTAFTVPGKQIMTVRPAYRDRVDMEDGTPPTVSRLIASTVSDEIDQGAYWKDWSTKHDYIVVLYTAKGEENPAPDLMDLAYDGEGFQLYRVVH